MGKMLSFLVASSLLAGLIGSVQAAELNQGYVVSNQGALGITRVFDDGDNTVLSFVDLDNQSPTLTDSAGKKIRFRQVGDYAVLPGKYDVVHVSVGQEYGVVRVATLQPPPPAAIGDERVSAGPTLATNAKVAGGLAPLPAPVAQTKPLPSAPVAGSAIGSPPAAVPGTAVADAKPSAVATAIKPTVSTPAPALAPKPVEPPKPIWRASAGSSLRAALQTWADQAGWQLRWEYGQDFPIDMPIQFTGSFKEAVAEFMRAYGTADLPPHACTYPDQQPKPLMRVISSAIKCDE